MIVVSILLAFGIDAGWGRYQDREDEREAIAQLRVDFEANAARLDTIRGMHEAALDAAYEFLARAGMGGEPRSEASTAEVVYTSLRAWSYDPVLGGINSLVQSGRLGLLRNDSLRVAVAGWPDIVEDLSGDELMEHRNTFEEWAPHLVSEGAMYDVLRAAGKIQRLDVEPASDRSELLSDPVLVQWMSWRVNGLENVLPEITTVEESIRRILELLESG
ncbi:MAG TPA: hypothetical protein VK858_02605 [Longimicrobiales bacterium]|nr:hypothetical protein [Longimicrobiales bacterium]